MVAVLIIISTSSLDGEMKHNDGKAHRVIDLGSSEGGRLLGYTLFCLLVVSPLRLAMMMVEESHVNDGGQSQGGRGLLQQESTVLIVGPLPPVPVLAHYLAGLSIVLVLPDSLLNQD